MAEDINRVIVVGRLTRDAELQYTASGYSLCKMSIACNRRRKQGDQWVDEANFFDVTLWGKRAESLSQYLTKGSQVAVEGQLKQDRWEQEGAKRSKVGIEASNIQLLGGKKDSQQGQQQQPGYSGNNYNQAQQGQSSYNQQNNNGQPERFEDDIPY